MGHTTKISDYELQRGDPVIDAADLDEPVTKSKVVESEDKPAPKKSTAKSK